MNARRKLFNFFEAHNLAPWFVGMSPNQTNALHLLLNELRDDYEQETCYRVDLCLRNIGIDLIIPRKQLCQLVQLSRGHDLAFLYFIYEFYYKEETAPNNNKERIYSSNEKLLMTSICKLDLIMTIRELDKLLPLGQSAKKAPTKQKDYLSATPQKSSKEHNKAKNILPYFQKQPRPKVNPSKRHVQKPNLVVRFPFWAVGKKPDLVVHNEERWFANYKLNPTARVVKNAVDDALNSFFEQFEKMELEKIEEKPKTDEVEAETEADATTATTAKPALCEYHRFWSQYVDTKKNQLRVEARERCLKVIDVTLYESRLRRERIAAQLAQDLNYIEHKYKNLQYSKIKLMCTNECQYECQICDLLVATGKPMAKDPLLLTNIAEIAHPHMRLPKRKIRLAGGGVSPCGRRIGTRKAGEPRIPPDTTHCERLPKATFYRDELPDSHSTENTECAKLVEKYHTAELKRCRIFGNSDNKNKRHTKITFEYDPLEIVDCCQKLKDKFKNIKYFDAPTEHKPYSFDYKNIFKVPNKKQPANARKIVLKHLEHTTAHKQEHLERLTDDEFEEKNLSNDCSVICSTCSFSTKSKEISSFDDAMNIRDSKQRVIDTVYDCTKVMWAERLRLKNIETERQIRLAAANTEDVVDEVVEPQRLEYKIDYFDPDDSELMDRLLKDGMNELRKDPRFVFAAMPDSHKIRALREWIKRRFGKSYTEKEATEDLEKSLDILKTVLRVLDNSPPKIDFMGMPRNKVSYEQFECMMQLGKKVSKAYTKKLDDDFMRIMTVCWLAFGSYLVPAGVPKNTFFAYIPAQKRDIKRNHPWQESDFRDMRQFRAERAFRK